MDYGYMIDFVLRLVSYAVPVLLLGIVIWQLSVALEWTPLSAVRRRAWINGYRTGYHDARRIQQQRRLREVAQVGPRLQVPRESKHSLRLMN